MKENNFNLLESLYEVLKTMDDKRAGKLVKAVGDYYFAGQNYTGKDTIIKTNFVMVKRIIDAKKAERACRCEECRRVQEDKYRKEYRKPNPYCGHLVVNEPELENVFKTLFSSLFEEEKPKKK